jgi:hypothetical protein
MALANQIIDFTDDTDKSILKLAAASAPEHIKTAKILTAEEREALSPDQFALVMRTKEAQVLKKFPTIDEANTWLSCQYFEKTSQCLPHTAQKIAAANLKRACAIYNIKSTPSIDKLASTDVSGNRYDEIKSYKEDKMNVKVASVVQVKPDGSQHFYALGEKYPMPTPDYVKKAAAYFNVHHRDFIDAEDRYTFAGHVKARAKELEVALEKQAEETLSKYVGNGYGDSVDKFIRVRGELLEHKPELKASLAKLASHKSTTEPEVFAKALYEFDKKAGISKYYDSYLADAFKTTFINTKVASAYSWEDDQSGSRLSGSALEKAVDEKHDKIKSYFGETLANSLKKHAVAIFDSLPIDAKITIAKIASGEI